MKVPSQLLLLLLAFCLGPQGAAAEPPALEVSEAWARPSLGTVPTGVVFLTIRNGGGADRLLGVETPVAERAELHTHVAEDGVMRMRSAQAVAVPEDGTAMLAPGGDHVMLFGLKQRLETGARFPLRLQFEHAGALETEVTVRALRDGGGKDAHGDGHGESHGGHGAGHRE